MVSWPATPARAREMRSMIIKMAKKLRAKSFATQVLACLNHVEDPSPDQEMTGWNYYAFFPDCHKKHIGIGEFDDYRLHYRT